MQLSNYRAGDRVEVFLIGAWRGAIVVNPQTAIMSLFVDLTAPPGAHVAVTDPNNIRRVTG